jgi:ERCC4-type nuclease
MRVIIDNREHLLYEKCETILTNDTGYARIEKQVLPIGDILIKTDEGKDVMIIERKTLADLLASIKDGRYEEQSHRLKYASGFPSHNILYIIEGMFSTLRTIMEKKLIISTMASLNYFKGFSVIRTSGIQETAEILIYFSHKIDRNFMKGILPSYLISPVNTSVNTTENTSVNTTENTSVNTTENTTENTSVNTTENTSVNTTENTTENTSVNTTENTTEPTKSYSGFVKAVKKENITQENISEIMLCQIPNISSVYAKSILLFFGGFSKMVDQIKNGTAKFDNITYETNGKQRRIPKTCGEQIIKYIQNI